MTSYLIISSLVILIIVTLAWWRQNITKNANSIDVIWSLGIGAQTVLLAAQADGDQLRRIIIAGLASFWALRLATHLFFDRVLSGKEDGRYARFRREWSAAAFYGLYLLQGVLIFLLPLTFLGGLDNADAFPATMDYVAISIWAISIIGESISDRQLAAFRNNPANKGKTCREGLWRYSRHPNYFFEWLIWCAYIPLAIGSPYFSWSLLGPALLLILLTKVSGIPPTETQAVESRGQDYIDYQKTTSAFVPWFPKE